MCDALTTLNIFEHFLQKRMKQKKEAEKAKKDVEDAEKILKRTLSALCVRCSDHNFILGVRRSA